MSHKRKGHTSDLTDAQWDLIKPLLPLEREGPGHPLELDLREVVNASFYIVRTGCQWANLPSDFPNHNSVYYHFHKWCKDGTWQRINETLRRHERRQQGREPEPNATHWQSERQDDPNRWRTRF